MRVTVKAKGLKPLTTMLTVDGSMDDRLSSVRDLMRSEFFTISDTTDNIIAGNHDFYELVDGMMVDHVEGNTFYAERRGDRPVVVEMSNHNKRWIKYTVTAVSI